jgi:hypothetical protein
MIFTKLQNLVSLDIAKWAGTLICTKYSYSEHIPPSPILGWSRTESTSGLLYQPRIMTMSKEQSVGWFAGETEVLGENPPSAALSVTNPTWLDRSSNSGRGGGKRRLPAGAKARPSTCLAFAGRFKTFSEQNLYAKNCYIPSFGFG